MQPDAADVFRADSPFVLEDSRRFRQVLPTTAAALNHKHAALLPHQVASGCTVLDLGCCIGATGYWALQKGAARYVGVERQEGFAAVGARLLAAYPQAHIDTADSMPYLAALDEDFDIVCMLGLAHGLFDPLAAIRQAASRTKRYFCFEDFGTDQAQPAIIAEPQMRMPIAGEKAGTVGFGWLISPLAMRHVMAFLGFAPDGEPLFLAENRWLCRYVRTRETEEKSASYSEVRAAWT